VPSRFLFPAVLLLMLAFAAFVGPHIDPVVARYGWVDLLLLVPVYFIAQNIASVGRKSTDHVFFMEAPAIPQGGEFHQEYTTPYNYSPPDWGGATLLGMFANTGVIACYGVPDALVRGAIAQGKPEYRGEAYVVGAAGAGGSGAARITKWTPNTATVHYDHATPGSLLVYNMNFDPSWRANGQPAIDHNFAVATNIPAGAGEVKFTYYPRTLNWGLALCAITALAGFGAPRLVSRRRASKSARSPSAAKSSAGP